MSAELPKILLCDDHQLIRDGLERVLSNSSGFGKIGEASSTPEALAAVRRESWDVVILDISLGGRSGMEALKEIKAEFPRLPVLVLSSYPESQFAVRAIRAGARGYLNKNVASRMLLPAIKQVLSGGLYVSPEVVAQLADAVQRPGGQPPHHSLSDREDQVMRLLGAGNSVGKIATQLSLSVKTVSTYRAIILRKLRLENNAQLIRYALENELGA